MKSISVYSPLNESAQFMIQRRHRIIRSIFASRFDSLKDCSLLEIGCGNGQWLAEFQMFGMNVSNLSGIELDASRAQDAMKRIKGADVRVGNASQLPWEDNSFDIVFQSTVFTSILDEDIRRKAASEMKRVCKLNGFILWYDFIYNSPSNPNVKGVRKNEIKNLFSPWNVKYKKVTLAPPIARRVVPVSWLAAEFLETFSPFLRTHAVAVISEK
jgi:ubiquinone/menaquinone biosynthesis C-methylase UbiE